ncbi:response regulator [Desulfobacter curvatus]
MIPLDVIMQGMSGYEIYRELKADTRTRHIPVIFITAPESQ